MSGPRYCAACDRYVYGSKVLICPVCCGALDEVEEPEDVE